MKVINNATWLIKDYPCKKYYGYHGYQVILVCLEGYQANATWLSYSLAKVIHARSIRLSWLSGYHRLLEGYQHGYLAWQRLSMLEVLGYHGYQVILDCWKVIRPMQHGYLA